IFLDPGNSMSAQNNMFDKSNTTDLTRDGSSSLLGDSKLKEKYVKILDIAKRRRVKIRKLENLIIELKSERDKLSVAHKSDATTTEEPQIVDPGILKSANSMKKPFNYKLAALLAFIFMPAVLVFLYTIFFYDSMYIASSTFTIKSNGNEKVNELASQVSFFGGGDNKELYTASAYVLSLDMFYELDANLNLIEHYSTHDIVSSLSENPTQSEIENYWKSVIEVKVDTESELMQLQVRSYSPEFSQKLSQAILSELDIFINKMNDKITQDSIKLASIEVEKAKQDIETISERIRKFRDQNTFIDPSSEATNLLSIISNLENIITQSKAELAQKRAYLREDSVDVISLKNKISSLEQEVSSLRSRIARNNVGVSSDNGSLGTVLSRTLSEFEQLNLEYQFAQKVLAAALNNLETTRQHSLSKSKYLVTIDNPKVPDEALWPRPFFATIITFVVTIFLLSAVSLLISAIKEHLGI
ncbi:hypothetical protein, partial [Succinimonas amylolytica]|uniref:hypothetical protein n=1 Tax=Succinimonas amylolytica TaxID=83769 RepID=UPI0023A8E91C